MEADVEHDAHERGHGDLLDARIGHEHDEQQEEACLKHLRSSTRPPFNSNSIGIEL